MADDRLVGKVDADYPTPEGLGLAAQVLSENLDYEYDLAGPVFVRLSGPIGWVKVNNFSACEQCRTSHVKCSLSETGGPCTHCKNRNQSCKVYGWTFRPEDPACHIYKRVLPPPPAAPPSPPFSQKDAYKFEWESLVRKLTWLQREAPRKFRKRSTAMPWKDDHHVIEPESPNRTCGERLQLPQRNTVEEFHALEKVSPRVPVSKAPSKRRRMMRVTEDSTCEYLSKTEEPMVTKTQHRMSISFILSPCNSEDFMKSDDNRNGSVESIHGWEATRTLITTEAGWSPRSNTPFASSPPADCSLKSNGPEEPASRNPISSRQIESQEILSKFQQWRPPI